MIFFTRTIALIQSAFIRCIVGGMKIIPAVLAVFVIASCGNKSHTNNTTAANNKNSAANTMPSRTVQKNPATSDEFSNQFPDITSAYIMPSPVDSILLNTVPKNIPQRAAADALVKKISNRINPETELYNYLEEKRNYVTSSIFSDIP